MKRQACGDDPKRRVKTCSAGTDPIRLHLKDQTAENSRKYATLGLGAVPNEKIVKAMAAARYDGWYTLENPVGDTYNDTVRQTALLKTWLAEAGGNHK